MTYKKNFKLEILQSELETFINTPREKGVNIDAVVAFSGGKDSAAALYWAKKKLNLEVVAVLVQNGFIPDLVINNGRNLCDKLGVELVVLTIELAPFLKDMMDKNFTNGYPCYKCGEMFHKEIQKYCGDKGINRVILGRNWWRWIEPEVRSVRWVKDEASGLNMQFFSLPFALQLTEKDVFNMLDEIGWKTVKIHGNSTNCVIPGLIEYPIYQRLGYHPELNLLSREVIAGFLDKEAAKEQLADIKDNTEILLNMVNKKLEESQSYQDKKDT
ncbi:MAG TPA: 7-cyano-7-deazaguanine synthase [Leptolyngbyaceae cyanobacterium]